MQQIPFSGGRWFTRWMGMQKKTFFSKTHQSFFFLCLSFSFNHTHTHKYTYALSLTHTHPPTYTHTISVSLSLLNTNTRTQTQTNFHSLSLCLTLLLKTSLREKYRQLVSIYLIYIWPFWVQQAPKQLQQRNLGNEILNLKIKNLVQNQICGGGRSMTQRRK